MASAPLVMPAPACGHQPWGAPHGTWAPSLTVTTALGSCPCGSHFDPHSLLPSHPSGLPSLHPYPCYSPASGTTPLLCITLFPNISPGNALTPCARAAWAGADWRDLFLFRGLAQRLPLGPPSSDALWAVMFAGGRASPVSPEGPQQGASRRTGESWWRLCRCVKSGAALGSLRDLRGMLSRGDVRDSEERTDAAWSLRDSLRGRVLGGGRRRRWRHFPF